MNSQSNSSELQMLPPAWILMWALPVDARLRLSSHSAYHLVQAETLYSPQLLLPLKMEYKHRLTFILCLYRK